MWVLFDMPACPTYVSEYIALLGDAAHASTSHAGAGAGMAIEDALILSVLLSDSKVTLPTDLPSVLTVYDSVRRPRTQRLVKHSRDAALLYQYRKLGVGDDLGKIRVDLENMQRWIWDMDVETYVQEAKEILGKKLKG
jgi:salicylate hydroxylase